MDEFGAGIVAILFLLVLVVGGGWLFSGISESNGRNTLCNEQCTASSHHHGVYDYDQKSCVCYDQVKP